MADRRYSTSAWQRTRRAILIRDGFECQVRGPKCVGQASSVHHLLPSSQFPHLFYDPGNLQAACTACNSGGGARIASDNRADRAMVTYLQAIVAEQQAEIEELTLRLQEHEQPKAQRTPRTPAIY